MSDELRRQFANPGKDYRSAPFWSWNDRMEPGEVRRQVRDMKSHGMGGFFMHSRVGLETPYMGPEWMTCIRAAVDEAKTIGIVLCSEKNDSMAKITLPENNEQILAARYQMYLPTEEELRAELAREREAAERVLRLAENVKRPSDGEG